MDLPNKLASEVHPTKGRVLLEAAWPEQRGFIIIDPTILRGIRYPDLGWVVETNCREALRKNDLVLIRSHTNYTERSYYDVFSVTIGDYKERLTILVDSEVEAVFKSQVEIYRANPSTHDRNVSVQDVESNEWYTFLTSDVIDFGFVELAHPAYSLEYIPTYMINLSQGVGEPLLLHYIIDYKNIIAIIKGDTLG